MSETTSGAPAAAGQGVRDVPLLHDIATVEAEYLLNRFDHAGMVIDRRVLTRAERTEWAEALVAYRAEILRRMRLATPTPS